MLAPGRNHIFPSVGWYGNQVIGYQTEFYNCCHHHGSAQSSQSFAMKHRMLLFYIQINTMYAVTHRGVSEHLQHEPYLVLDKSLVLDELLRRGPQFGEKVE